MKVCSGCKEVSYCSKACQKKDWPNHKGLCAKTEQIGVKFTKYKSDEKMKVSSSTLRILPDELQTPITPQSCVKQWLKDTSMVSLKELQEEDKSKSFSSYGPARGHLQLTFLTSAMTLEDTISFVGSGKDITKLKSHTSMTIDLVEVIKCNGLDLI